MIGEQTDGVGKKAEKQTHQEMRNLRARSPQAAFLQLKPFRQPAEKLRGLLRNLRIGALGAQNVIVAEERTENIERRKRASCGNVVAIEIVEAESIHARRCCGEVGMHLKSLKVADH